MKKTYLWLSSQELKQMLRGSLQWNDVANRVTISKKGMRKIDASILKKQSAPNQEVHPANAPANDLPKEKDTSPKRLEGRVVILLLGSVGVLTLSSWFYFVIFAQ